VRRNPGGERWSSQAHTLSPVVVVITSTCRNYTRTVITNSPPTSLCARSHASWFFPVQVRDASERGCSGCRLHQCKCEDYNKCIQMVETKVSSSRRENSTSCEPTMVNHWTADLCRSEEHRVGTRYLRLHHLYAFVIIFTFALMKAPWLARSLSSSLAWRVSQRFFTRGDDQNAPFGQRRRFWQWTRTCLKAWKENDGEWRDKLGLRPRADPFQASILGTGRSG
jgi:hypothetical protein